MKIAEDKYAKIFSTFTSRFYNFYNFREGRKKVKYQSNELSQAKVLIPIPCTVRWKVLFQKQEVLAIIALPILMLQKRTTLNKLLHVSGQTNGLFLGSVENKNKKLMKQNSCK